MLSAVIFDFDGIVVDSEPLHYQAFQAVLAPRGKGFSWEKYCSTFLGFDDREIFRRVFGTGETDTPPGLLRQLITEKAEAFRQCINEEGVIPYPGVVELIRTLGRQLPIALCSGGLRGDILPILRKLGIEHAFDTVVTADDTPRSKPDPAPYLLAVRKLGIADAATAVAIEDTNAGIASARGAGLRVLAVTNSFDRDRLVGPDAVTESLEDINFRNLSDLT